MMKEEIIKDSIIRDTIITKMKIKEVEQQNLAASLNKVK